MKPDQLDTRPYCPELCSRDEYFTPIFQSLLWRGQDIPGVDTDEMDVTISLAGLTPNQAHMQHIHGAHGTLAICPTLASANADGIITLAAGTPAYGPVALPFEPTPTADASGKITWSRTLRLLPDDIYNIKTLTEHVVLIHGMPYKGVYDQTLPVACGPIKAA